MKGRITGFLIICVLLSSCFKEPEFALSPVISYEKYTSDILLDPFLGATKDSVVVTIHFRDGDGDLGLDVEGMSRARETDDYNFIVKSFRKRGGVFSEYIPADPPSGFFPQLKLDEKPGPIEGFLSYTMDFIHAFTPKRDTVKFEIQIKDRAGNLSNVTETEEIILNRL
jgi:hypothetical protein